MPNTPDANLSRACQDKLDSRQARWRSSNPVKPSVLHMPPSNTADPSCLDPGSAEMPSQFFHLESDQTDSNPPQPSRQTKKKRTHATSRKRNTNARPRAAAASSKQQAASLARRRSVSREGLPSHPNRTAGAEQQARYGTLLRPPTGAPALPCPVPIVRWAAGRRKSKIKQAVITDGAAAHSSPGSSPRSLTGFLVAQTRRLVRRAFDVTIPAASVQQPSIFHHFFFWGLLWGVSRSGDGRA